MLTLIQGGHVIDPASAIDGRCDLWIRDQTIVEPVNDRPPHHTIDATGCVVMAGAIDMHTHIGGGKLTLARLLLQDQFPRGSERTSEFLPAASVVGQRYLDMGYTTCFEPAVIPCNARSAHAEMADVNGIDTGGYCLLGNDDVLLQLLSEDSPQAIINDYVAWMVAATKCIAVKVVNPGGISAFKFNTRTFDVNTPHPKYGVTPSTIIRRLCRAVHEIGLAHPLHVHCSNLGVPGNIASTLATIEAAHGLPIHLTHAQFHSYGDSGTYKMSSAAEPLARALQAHPNVTIDVGQVMFGQTVTISADSMHQYDNHTRGKPRKSVLVDVECEAGCGVVPFRYHRKKYVHSLQWAIGLELFLMIDDPKRVFLTTDHPNGGPFTAYPHLIRLLGDRSYRETALAEIEPEAAAASQLSGMSREYSLHDIATMTRSAPAALLGLNKVGSLRPDCHADIVIYRKQDNLERMFAEPEYVIRRGSVVRGCGSVDAATIPATTHTADVHFDANAIPGLAQRYAQQGTMAMQRLMISDDEMEGVLGTKLEKHAAVRSGK